MSLQFTDALELGKPRRTKEGYLAVRARAARTGVYQYDGRQIDPTNQHGLRDAGPVNVLRDDETVFDAAAVQSFIGKPVTIDHPGVSVTAANWKDFARGAVMGALRDGQYLAFDLLLMDQAAIAAVEDGRRQLSNGYEAELEFGDFVAADGTKCPARQSRIHSGNHVAVLRAGRAGSECRISDGGNSLFAACDTAAIILSALDAPEEPKKMKTMLIDGLTVDIANADTAEATIRTLITARDAATAKVTGLETQVATLTTEKATADAKVVTLEKQVKDARNPAALRAAAQSYSQVCDKAKALGVAITDEMDEAAIQKAVVTAKLGDAAKDWTDVQIAASFATLTADTKIPSSNVVPIIPSSGGISAISLRDAARAASAN